MVGPFILREIESSVKLFSKVQVYRQLQTLEHRETLRCSLGASYSGTVVDVLIDRVAMTRHTRPVSRFLMY